HREGGVDDPEPRWEYLRAAECWAASVRAADRKREPLEGEVPRALPVAREARPRPSIHRRRAAPPGAVPRFASSPCHRQQGLPAAHSDRESEKRGRAFPPAEARISHRWNPRRPTRAASPCGGAPRETLPALVRAAVGAR